MNKTITALTSTAFIGVGLLLVFLYTNSKTSVKGGIVFAGDIVKLTKENTNYRNVITTATHSQVVLMSIPPGGDIGKEAHHHLDQVLVFIEGEGEAQINDKKLPIVPNTLFLIPAGTIHNFVNTSKTALKLYTIYSPPEHKHGIVRATKEEAEAVPE